MSGWEMNGWVNAWVREWMNEWMSKQVSLQPLWKRIMCHIRLLAQIVPWSQAILRDGFGSVQTKHPFFFMIFFPLHLGCQSPLQKKQLLFLYCLNISSCKAVCQCFGILWAPLLVAENFLLQEIKLILRAKQSLNIASWHRYLKSCVHDVMSEQRRRRK